MRLGREWWAAFTLRASVQGLGEAFRGRASSSEFAV